MVGEIVAGLLLGRSFLGEFFPDASRAVFDPSSVGRDLGVISPTVFCMLVLMALITTIMATPILLRAMPGTELEQPIRDSGFLQRRSGN